MKNKGANIWLKISGLCIVLGLSGCDMFKRYGQPDVLVVPVADRPLEMPPDFNVLPLPQNQARPFMPHELPVRSQRGTKEPITSGQKWLIEKSGPGLEEGVSPRSSQEAPSRSNP